MAEMVIMTDGEQRGNLKIITLGCRLNTYESEVIRGLIGQSDLSEGPPLFVVNTCSVTEDAKRQSRREVRKIRARHSDAKIYVTGCASQLNPELYAGIADRVIGNADKLSRSSYAINADKLIMRDMNQLSRNDHGNIVTSFTGKSRAFVEIQNGCDHKCTFCSIPLSRGNNRSTPQDHIIHQISLLSKAGYNEVTLTGVDITNYGTDIGTNFSALVGSILKSVPTLDRLRLSSLDVAEVDNELIRLFATNDRLMPHIHLSLQSGDNMILKRMRRRHCREQIYAFCETMRSVRRDVVFGSDVIAGFPTETDEMFENTYNLLRELDFYFIHVFPFSANTNTVAARMPQVKGAIIKHRARTLRDLAAANFRRLQNTLIGTRQKVLLEKEHCGKTEQYVDLTLSHHADQKLVGAIIEVKVDSISDGKLLCTQTTNI